MDVRLEIKKSICEIMTEDGYSSGFFTKINYKNNGIYCLMANYNAISETMLNNDYFEVKIDNKCIKKIYLNKKRWSNKDLDYICIEITKDDDIEILETEDGLGDNENKYEDYGSKDIIVVSINKDKKIEAKKEKLIYREKCDKFFYTCDIEKGFSGGLLILNNNFKIIGIHYRNEIKENLTEGIYLNNIIKDINRYNLIEGIINIKNNVLFNSKEEIISETYTLFLRSFSSSNNYCYFLRNIH